MAPDSDGFSPDEQVSRSVGRSLGNLLFFGVVVAAAAGWMYLGTFTLRPGQAAIIIRLGEHVDTITEQGLHFRLPPPLEYHEKVEVSKIEREEFGVTAGIEPTRAAIAEAAMQTGDNNIVHMSFVVRYRLRDAFEARYSLADPVPTLREASQAALREVVGATSIDEVISQGRGEVEVAALERLQAILDLYNSGLVIDGIELQEVQPPEEVRAAFDDVIAASQDGSRKINEAEGYRNEVLPGARAEAAEIIASADAYREAVVAESTGETQRFSALAAEYRRSPEVTRQRMYLETMEAVLPGVEKVIIEPGSAQVLPYLPLGDRGGLR